MPINNKTKTLTATIKRLFDRANVFFNLYEKIWLAFFISIGIIVTVITKESPLFMIVLIAGFFMELTLAKRSKWCFIFVLINSLGLIIIGLITSLYSEILVNALFWIPYAIGGFILWNKNLDIEEKQNLTVVRSLKHFQTFLIVVAIISLSLLRVPSVYFFNGTFPLLDALSTFFQLATGILILLRLKQQWIFWIGYIFVSAFIWILLNQWIMLIVSFGYFSNSIYGLINWSKYTSKHSELKNISIDNF